MAFVLGFKNTFYFQAWHAGFELDILFSTILPVRYLRTFMILSMKNYYLLLLIIFYAIISSSQKYPLPTDL